ncbi:MAG TPA: T9SS type A sorting domain-containing protein [Bacteroidia bacterium]|nr:T9SS type A sorting domain-containing protein [Bacteroidia bacterium]
MKKLLTLLCLSCLAFMGQAQTIMYQNFEVSKNAKPAGWSIDAIVPANAGWEFNNTYGAQMNNYIPLHTYCAFVNELDNNYPAEVKAVDTLKTPVMNCSAATHVYISYSFMTWNDEGHEVSTIAVSKDNGSTWNTAVTLPDNQSAWSDSVISDISAFAAGQANVKVAFCYSNGYAFSHSYAAIGMGVDNIDVYAPAAFSANVTSQNLPYLLQVGTPYTFTGTAFNAGYTQITTMDMHYSVNGGPMQTQTVSGIAGFTTLNNTNWSLNTIPFTPAAAGNITVKYWVDNLNGNPNGSPNDTLIAHFIAVNTVQPKLPVFEEFSNASCNPCMYAVPNVDSVITNNLNSLNPVRYHWYFPGRDFMNQETSGLVNSRMNTYYGQYGVPVGELDGSQIYPGAGGFSTAAVSQAKSVGSPFTINITTANYNSVTKVFTARATITSYGTFPAGLTAQTILTVDTIVYAKNQSQEDPDASFVSFGGSNPDYLRPGVLNFPNVVEAMLPSVSGSALAAFTPLSTQNLNLTWTKNHPWGIYPKGTNAALTDTTLYDSTNTYHFTIFVQTNAGIVAGGVPSQYVFQSASAPVYITTGLEELSNGVSFEMYPNPTNSSTNIAFKLDQTQDVNVQVYNVLGEKVYSVDNGRMAAGQHTMNINCSGFESGVYFVKFTTDNATTTKRLVIQQ